MRTRPQTRLPSVLALALISLLATPLVALAEEPTLSMSPETARPGSTVEISGSHFPAEYAVELRLTTPDGSMALADSATGIDGTFQELVALPLGVTRGDWRLQATAVDGTTSTLDFSTLPQPAPAEAAPVEPATTAERSGNTGGDIAVLLIIAVVLGGIAFGGMVVIRQLREESPPGMGKGDDLIWGGGSAETPEKTATAEPHWKSSSQATGQASQPAQTES